jgi:hypothetical protein
VGAEKNKKWKRIQGRKNTKAENIFDLPFRLSTLEKPFYLV